MDVLVPRRGEVIVYDFGKNQEYYLKVRNILGVSGRPQPFAI